MGTRCFPGNALWAVLVLLLAGMAGVGTIHAQSLSSDFPSTFTSTFLNLQSDGEFRTMNSGQFQSIAPTRGDTSGYAGYAGNALAGYTGNTGLAGYTGYTEHAGYINAYQSMSQSYGNSALSAGYSNLYQSNSQGYSSTSMGMGASQYQNATQGGYGGQALGNDSGQGQSYGSGRNVTIDDPSQYERSGNRNPITGAGQGRGGTMQFSRNVINMPQSPVIGEASGSSADVTLDDPTQYERTGSRNKITGAAETRGHGTQHGSNAVTVVNVVQASGHVPQSLSGDVTPTARLQASNRAVPNVIGGYNAAYDVTENAGVGAAFGSYAALRNSLQGGAGAAAMQVATQARDTQAQEARFNQVAGARGHVYSNGFFTVVYAPNLYSKIQGGGQGFTNGAGTCQPREISPAGCEETMGMYQSRRSNFALNDYAYSRDTNMNVVPQNVQNLLAAAAEKTVPGKVDANALTTTRLGALYRTREWGGVSILKMRQ